MQNTFFIILTLFLLLSCNHKNKKPSIEESKDTLVVKDTRNINAIGVTLTPEAQEFVETWTQYVQFDTFITRYYAISNSEALMNAKDLSKMAIELKDSINIEILKTPSTFARFNILDNECKRLADMSTIKAITQPEVSRQIKKILEAYSSVNANLNTVLSLQNMESELQLDPDFKAILSQVPELESKKTAEEAIQGNTGVTDQRPRKILSKQELDRIKKKNSQPQ